MHKLIVLAGVVAATVLPLPAVAQQSAGVVGTAPGAAGAARTMKMTATITAIDPATREVTLKGEKGNETTVTAGPKVTNFAQMKVGDRVSATYIEALTLELKKGGGLPVARTEAAGMGKAAPGERPAGGVGRRITIVADVVDIDTAKKLVTLRGPQRTVQLPVNDPEQLKLIAKGDQVEATYTEGVAIAVEPVAKK
jgi:Cu/Ag efflux protein CusF